MSRLSIVLSAVLTAALAAACSVPSKPTLETYTPSQQFRPAFEAIMPEGQDSGCYDLEKTIRVMNALEIAQARSEDFDSFLEVMAREDYTGVAPEVMNAKAQLLPVFQRLYELRKADEAMGDVWMLARSAGAGLDKMAGAATEALASSTMPEPMLILTLSSTKSLRESAQSIFEAYSKEQELKDDLQRELEAVKMAYLDYLADYAPIYHKYMKEWDKLCIRKDKAYLDIYGGRYADAYESTNEILQTNPLNREAMLLHATAAVELATAHASNETDSPTPGKPLTEVKNHASLIAETDSLLNAYKEAYPSRTAPALVIEAMRHFAQGNDDKALSCLDQAAIEYPRQAANLTDLLDSYKCRTYLNMTPEGLYLLRLYRSTMEGYGLFSPNLQKAQYYERLGNTQKSAAEIFNHFFRRGNQGIYDCLLSDMEFCEQNLTNSFHNILIEHSYLDLEVTQPKDWKFSSIDNQLAVALRNRSDIDFENVRVFLCIHYTDMYADEYEVVKTQSKNILRRYDKLDMGTVSLPGDNRKFSDITRIRAIAMTDDRICWIDQPSYKIAHASSMPSHNDFDKMKEKRKRMLKRDFQMDEHTVLKLVRQVDLTYAPAPDKSIISSWLGNDGHILQVSLPRSLTMLDPLFSLGPIADEKRTLPRQNILKGDRIVLDFETTASDGLEIPLMMYSDYFNMRIDIAFRGQTPEVVKVSPF